MKNQLLPLLLLGSTLLFSCERAFMDPSPGTTNLEVYDAYWQAVDEKFAMHSDPGKGIDKILLRDSTRALVSDEISSDSLFNVLGKIVIALKDGHSFVADIENERFADYLFETGVPKNLDQSIVDQHYLNQGAKTLGDAIRYTTLENGQVGYFEYRDFEGEVTDEMLNQMLTEFSETKGLIIDLRGNGGGSPAIAAEMARHFTKERAYVGYENFKSGPGENDFVATEIYVEPSTGVNYTKPIMVLTNIDCFSATTTFIYHLNTQDHVTFVGAKTGGGSGAPASGYLPNGWVWTLSTTEFIDFEGTRLDNGFNPDIEVALDSSNPNQDEIIERAIMEIL